MPCKLFRQLCLVTILLFLALRGLAQTETPWTAVGPVNGGDPYNLYYYKLAQVNNNAHRYASLIEVSIQGDANYYHDQGTYMVRIDKYEGTLDRFDGMEITCTSGNPGAAIFYIFNNALWVKSNYQWGAIYYKATHLVSGNPITGGNFAGTETEPSGYLYKAYNSGVKCDFDNNKFYTLPFTDVFGNTYNSEGLILGNSVKSGLLTLNGVNRGNNDYVYITKSANSANTDIYSNYTGSADIQSGVISYGVRPTSQSWEIFEKGHNANWTNLMHVGVDGNVGIGTITPQAKLAVKGTIQAERVKVTTAAAAWPDYVFAKDYKLPTLQELENYVSTHQHLPGIPAAAEIAKDGQDLGEINQKLLQKIEELTLYIINLEKRINKIEQKP